MLRQRQKTKCCAGELDFTYGLLKKQPIEFWVDFFTEGIIELEFIDEQVDEIVMALKSIFEKLGAYVMVYKN